MTLLFLPGLLETGSTMSVNILGTFNKNVLIFAGLGIRSSIFWANRSFFVKCGWVNEQFAQKNEQFAHWLIFGEQPERFAHGRSFLVSDLSDLLIRSFLVSNLSDLLIRSFLVSDLIDLLTSLIKKRGNDWTYKKRTKKYDCSQVFF